MNIKKHAYLLIVHNEFRMLEKLLLQLDDERNDIYIHIDKKTKWVDEEKIASCVKHSQVYFVPGRKVYWGDLSMVKCEFTLLKEATGRGSYHYYHLVSGVDFPLKTQEEIHDFFREEDREFVSWHTDGVYDDHFMYKVQYYHPLLRIIGKGIFTGTSKKDRFMRKLGDLEYRLVEKQKAKNMDRTKKYKDTVFYKGAQWFSITHEFAMYLLSREKESLKMFFLTNGPDELFVQTAMMNSKFKDKCAGTCMRRVDWKRGNPYEFVLEDYEELDGAEELFARKISYRRQTKLVEKLAERLSPEAEKKEKPLISMILPIYNVEAYLRQCLDSVKAQTYANIEVLMIDDGSTDTSSVIAKEYSEKYENFRYIRQENGGLSAARNTGISEAKGEYLAFVDSDDWIDPLYTEKLYEACAKYGAKLSVCGYCKEDRETGSVQFDKEALLSGEEAMKCLGDIYQKEDVLMVVAWNKLYHRSIFETLRYPVGKIHEDEFIAHRVIGACDKVALLTEDLYHYRIRTGSITGSDKKQDLRHLDLIAAQKDRILYTRQMYYTDFYILLLYSYFETLTQLMVKYDKETFEKEKLNKRFRKAILEVYGTYFWELDSHQKKEYFKMWKNPFQYKCHVEDVIAQKQEKDFSE